MTIVTKSSKLIAGILAFGLSVSAANTFAACTQAQEKIAGKQIADSVAANLRADAPAQSKRLIKVLSCDVTDGVITADFTYNYVSEKHAYAVDGQARIDANGQVELAQIDSPAVIYASIKTYYVE